MWWVVSLIFLFGIATELIAILNINSGHFVYSLDDAYIHLALAENIARGHYGVNRNEFSAPSSSILWPFILAPIAGLPIGHWAPLIINIISAFGTLFIFWRIITFIFQAGAGNQKYTGMIIGFILLILIPSTNLIALIFTGMEHSLQVFFSVLVVWGVIQEMGNKKVSWWLSLALILGPLIRYENLVISLPVIAFLFFRGHRKISILNSGLIMLALGVFSVFLLSMEQKILPTSILSQSSIFAFSDIFKMFLIQTHRSIVSMFVNSRMFLLVIDIFILILFIIRRGTHREERFMAAITTLAIFMQIFFGNFGYQNRVEIYIWTYAIMQILYLYRRKLQAFLSEEGPLKLGLVALLWAILLSPPYMRSLLKTPTATNNIYEQHYQMHLFAVDFYKRNIAVNDLGYVSYRNENYVLTGWIFYVKDTR